MRIHPVSDLHLEFNRDTRYAAKATERRASEHAWGPPKIDVLVAAGDIHLGTLAPGWLRALYRAGRILYVPGNHEYYGERLDLLDDRLREECRRHELDFLQGDTVEIDDVVFLGCTLWTDFKAFAPVVRATVAGRMAEEALADYELIEIMSRSKGTPRRITWRDTAALHQRQLAWLDSEIERHRGRPLVIVTHHAPSLALSHPEYASDPVTAAFCNRLGDLVERSGALYWICGHSHWPKKVRIGKTLVVNNSCGYVGEHMEENHFDGALILEV
jgi:Icc-related predicted phosphoesterase